MIRVKSFSSFINESVNYIKFWDRGQHVKLLQTALENLGFPLQKWGVDGIYGPETHAASQKTIETISQLTNIKELVNDPNVLQMNADGLSKTQFDVVTVLGNDDKLAQAIRTKMGPNSANVVENTDIDMATKQMIQKNIPDASTFMQKVNEVSKYLGINPNWLLAVIYKECRFKPSAQNPTTHATGLIQFMPATATGLGTSVEALKTMTATQQMEYVQKYLSAWKGKMKSVVDVYMTVFYPYAVSQSDNFVIGSQKGDAEAQKIADRNPAISQGKDVITKADFKNYVTKDLPADLAASV